MALIRANATPDGRYVRVEQCASGLHDWETHDNTDCVTWHDGRTGHLLDHDRQMEAEALIEPTLDLGWYEAERAAAYRGWGRPMPAVAGSH